AKACGRRAPGGRADRGAGGLADRGLPRRRPASAPAGPDARPRHLQLPQRRARPPVRPRPGQGRPVAHRRPRPPPPAPSPRPPPPTPPRPGPPRPFALALVKGGRSRIGDTVHVPVNGTLVPVEVTGSVLGDPEGGRRGG